MSGWPISGWPMNSWADAARGRLRGWLGARVDPGEVGDVLCLSVSELGWRMTLRHADGDAPTTNDGRADVEASADTAAMLRRAVRAVTPAQRERIGSVRLLVEDRAIYLADNRSIRIKGDDPVAIRQAGVQELGSLGATYAFQAFGASSEHEVRRGAYAFLSAQRMQDYFGALDSLAVKLVELRPASLLRLAAEGDAPFAILDVRALSSTLLLADPRTGAAICREIPVGAHSFAVAVAEATSVSVAEASAGLERRACFHPNAASEGEPAPATTTERALAPILAGLREQLLASLEYFVFQRLAGAPERLALAGQAERVRGLMPWLGAVLELSPEPAEDLHGRFADGPVVDTCNLLATIPKGLLKIGKAEYRFADGRFSADGVQKPAQPAQAARVAVPGGSWRPRSWQPGALGAAWAPLAGVAAVLAGTALMVWLTLAASSSQLDQASGALAASLDADAILRSALVKRTAPAAPGTERRPLYWTEKLTAVAAAMPDGLQLTRLTTSADAPGGVRDAKLVLEGEASATGDYLRQVNELIGHLTNNAAFMSDVSGVAFDGTSDGQSLGYDAVRFAVTVTLKTPAKGGGQ